MNQLPSERTLLEMEPTTWACVQTRNQTGDFLIHGLMLNL